VTHLEKALSEMAPRRERCFRLQRAENTTIGKDLSMPKFMDFHPNFRISPERVAQLRQETAEGKVDQYGVRQLELFHSPDGNGVYCLLEGPDEVAVRSHHNGNCGEVIRVESLL
jgi:hypothetical protein